MSAAVFDPSSFYAQQPAAETKDYIMQQTMIRIKDAEGRRQLCMRTPGCVELTFNYGTEKEDGPSYHTGNTSAWAGHEVKGGFGHVGITVPNVYDAVERLVKAGVEVKKSPNSGGMKGIAFVKDPDGYWIELLPHSPQDLRPVDCCGVALEQGGGYQGGGGGTATLAAAAPAAAKS